MLIIVIEKIKDPTAPEIVFFGLIFVNLGPLIILPITYPPISDAMHPKRIIKKSIFKGAKFENIKNKAQNVNIKIMNKIFVVNFFMLLEDTLLFILKNSIIEKIPKIISENKRKISLIKIRNNKNNKEMDVANLFLNL